LQILLRAVPGKSVGGETELKNGVTTTQFYLFFGTVHMEIPGNTPTHRILIDFRSTPPGDAVFPGTALSQNVH